MKVITRGGGVRPAQTAVRTLTHRYSTRHSQDKKRQRPSLTTNCCTTTPVQQKSAQRPVAQQPRWPVGLRLHGVYAQTAPIQLHPWSVDGNANGQDDQRDAPPKRAEQWQTTYP